MQYKSYVVVFDEMFYFLSIVYVILEKLILEIKILILSIEFIYYWIDGLIS